MIPGAISCAREEGRLRPPPSCCSAPKPTSAAASRRRCFATVPEGAVTRARPSRTCRWPKSWTTPARFRCSPPSASSGWSTPRPPCRAAVPTRTIPNPAGPPADAAPLAAYLKDPTPGVVLVFEASRFDFEGDDKRKQERVRKFYSRHPRRGGTAPLQRARSPRRGRIAGRARRLPHRTRGARPAGGSSRRRHRPHRRGNRKAGAVRRNPRRVGRTISPPWCRMRAPPRSSPW